MVVGLSPVLRTGGVQDHSNISLFTQLFHAVAAFCPTDFIEVTAVFHSCFRTYKVLVVLKL